MANLVSSRVLSRLLPVADGDTSMLTSLRRDFRGHPDVEAQHNSAPQQTPGQAPFHDDYDDNDVPDEFLYDANDLAIPPTDPSIPSTSPEIRPSQLNSPELPRGRSAWLGGKRAAKIDDNGDVLESLLIGGRRQASSSSSRPPPIKTKVPNSNRAEEQWKVAQESKHIPMPSRSAKVPQGRGSNTASVPRAHADATWLFTNAHNLDTLLLEVYQYFVEHGVWSILLSRVISLLTELFVFSFAIFLTTCIDYSKVPTSHSTSEVLIPKCMKGASWIKKMALFFFVMYWLWKAAYYIKDVRRLFRLHDFFHHVLGIQDQNIQTTQWARVVEGLTKVADANVATANTTPLARKYLNYQGQQQRLSAETVANRLMRQANYYVAMYNKDILDFTLPIPFVGQRQFYSKSLEWCIDFCLTNFIFDERGSIRPFCLDVRNRSALVSALRVRLRFTALTSIIVAPINILRFCVMYFFRYYTEFTRNPSKVSARSFTPHAEWKIRQFNELDHLFERRIRSVHPFANEYLKQFPKDKIDQICRFVAFISGAIAAVLTLATLLDPELFLNFQVTPGRTAVFWLTVMVGIFGVANGALPEETEVHDPVLHLKAVVHIMGVAPSNWKSRLHSNEVRAEFSAMYQMKILIFVEEVLSLIVAPCILWRNSNANCARLIDFFREHTVHVEGVGHQCNFAVFNFKKHPDLEDPTAILRAQDELLDDYYGLKDNKMAASIHNFQQYYSIYNRPQNTRRHPGWQPPPAWPQVMQNPTIVEENIADQEPTTNSTTILPNKHRTLAQSARYPAKSARTGRSRDGIKASTQIRRSHDGQPAHTVSESRLMAQDSDLQEFADAPGVTLLESDSDDDATSEQDPDKNAGVLGLLYEFSRAQTEKGAGGVQI